MIIVALIAFLFYRGAKKRNLNVILWTIVGGLSYFLGQILVGFFLGFTNPGIVNDQVGLTVIGLFSGIVASVITFVIMQAVHSRKVREKINAPNENLIDDAALQQNSNFDKENVVEDI